MKRKRESDKNDIKDEEPDTKRRKIDFDKIKNEHFKLTSEQNKKYRLIENIQSTIQDTKIVSEEICSFDKRIENVLSKVNSFKNDEIINLKTKIVDNIRDASTRTIDLVFSMIKYKNKLNDETKEIENKIKTCLKKANEFKNIPLCAICKDAIILDKDLFPRKCKCTFEKNESGPSNYICWLCFHKLQKSQNCDFDEIVCPLCKNLVFDFSEFTA